MLDAAYLTMVLLLCGQLIGGLHELAACCCNRMFRPSTEILRALTGDHRESARGGGVRIFLILPPTYKAWRAQPAELVQHPCQHQGRQMGDLQACQHYYFLHRHLSKLALEGLYCLMSLFWLQHRLGSFEGVHYVGVCGSDVRDLKDLSSA